MNEKFSLKDFSKQLRDKLKLGGISNKLLSGFVMTLMINGCTNKDILNTLRNDGGMSQQEAIEIIDGAENELEEIKNHAIKGFDMDSDGVGIMEVDLDNLPQEFEKEKDLQKVERQNYSYLVGYYKISKKSDKKEIAKKLNIDIKDIPDDGKIPTIVFQSKVKKQKV